MRSAGASLLGAMAILCSPACSRGRSAHRIMTAEGGPAPSSASDDLLRIARAEDTRRAVDLPAGAQSRDDVSVRRAAARALARILDIDDGALLRALQDEDEEVVAWASYGLGESCRGHEERHARALAARLASLTADRSAERPATGGTAAAGSTVVGRRVVATMLRALGRCGSEPAEAVLRQWVRRGGPDAEAASYALGDIAARHGLLSSESAAALLDAALAPSPADAALLPFCLPEVTFGPELEARLTAAARRSLARPGPLRMLAVRALARTGATDVAAELARILTSDEASPTERIEAAAGLALAPSSRMSALAQAVSSMTGRGPAFSGDEFTVLLAAVERLEVDASTKRSEVDASTKGRAALATLARVRPPAGADEATLRRASALRCAAAAKLAGDAWDSGVVRDCDLGDGEAGEKAGLRTLDRGSLVAARRSAWYALTRSGHVRIREAALEAIVRHPELGDAAPAAVAAALSGDEPGVVAAAAKVVRSHPRSVFALAASERRAALDPSSPPPTSRPATELDPTVARTLRSALARPWRADLVETRAALLEAAVAAGLEEGRSAARRACTDDNATLRARAGRALTAAGEAACGSPGTAPEPAPEIGQAVSTPTRISFETDAGPLDVVLDPSFAPIAVTRLVGLARAGFYAGTSLHRVVPGFVVQFGDPGGDGYGGCGKLLRCETAPVPFEALDVGVAIAGRDTGSSQLFIALSRSPEFDGRYAWVGRAEGDWNAVAQGDRIRAVRVDEDRAARP